MREERRRKWEEVRLKLEEARWKKRVVEARKLIDEQATEDLPWKPGHMGEWLKR